MTEAAALDEFVGLVQMNTNPNELLRLSIPQGLLDRSVRYMAGRVPDIYREALQDPRFKAYCQEQEAIERLNARFDSVYMRQDKKAERPLDLRAINRKLAGHNDPLGGGDTSALDFIETPEYLAQRRSFVIGQMMDD